MGNKGHQKGSVRVPKARQEDVATRSGTVHDFKGFGFARAALPRSGGGDGINLTSTIAVQDLAKTLLFYVGGSEIVKLYGELDIMRLRQNWTLMVLAATPATGDLSHKHSHV